MKVAKIVILPILLSIRTYNQCVCVCVYESSQPHGEWNEVVADTRTAKTKRHGFVLPTRESVRLNHVVHATGPHTKRLEYSLKPFLVKGSLKSILIKQSDYLPFPPLLVVQKVRQK
jgi:hypothetical protein